MEKYRETGGFAFVKGLKWNQHLYSEEFGSSRGYFTEALILKLEAR